MARIFSIPGAVLLFAAFVLNFIVSISLPYLPLLDISRTRFDQVVREDGQTDVTRLGFGVWAPCFYHSEQDRTCPKTSYAYNITVTDLSGNEVLIDSAWTLGLVIHPAATAVSLFAFVLALSPRMTIALITTWTAWLASLVTFIVFLIDIALYVWTKRQFKKLDAGARTSPAPGFWLTFFALILLLAGGASTWLGGRVRQRAADAAKSAKNLSAADVDEFAGDCLKGW